MAEGDERPAFPLERQGAVLLRTTEADAHSGEALRGGRADLEFAPAEAAEHDHH